MIYDEILADIKDQYLSDDTPWVVAFSGGKDSTTVLQLVFYALQDIPRKKLTKPIHVLSNDTLVENPIIIKNLDEQLSAIKKSGKERLYAHNPSLFTVVKTKPKLNESFWVNLIGKGYPSPNRWFRWCTQRMKINPTVEYVKNIANKNGKTIVILGTRKAESINRTKQMNKYDNGKRLKNYIIPNTYVFTPISELSNDDVWIYLMQIPNPWGYDNKRLVTLYRNASGECPLVMETGTQSCGFSRFGCWTCTVVNKDQSMENLVYNGHEWLEELVEFRNYLAKVRLQDEQFVPGKIKDKVKFGPFLLKTRKNILKKLQEIQKSLSYELINKEELVLVKKLLKNGYTQERLKKYIFKLPDGKRVTVVSDFNPLESERKQIGSMPLKYLKFLKTENLPPKSEYLKSTRVIYY